MIYKFVRSLSVSNRSIAQTNKKFGFKLTRIDISFLFFVVMLHGKGEKIRRERIKEISKLCDIYMDNRRITNITRKLNKYELITTDVEEFGIYTRHTYYPTPLLFSYMKELEERLRMVRWDY